MTERLDPAEQEALAQAIRQKLAEIEEEHEWEALVRTPKSQAFLERLSSEIDEKIAAGEFEEGGWEL